MLTQRVLPTVVSALTHIASTRPAAPLLELAEALSRAADTLDGESVDPYSDPQYEIQVHKIEAKKARVEARAAAEAEKQVQRER